LNIGSCRCTRHSRYQLAGAPQLTGAVARSNHVHACEGNAMRVARMLLLHLRAGDGASKVSRSGTTANQRFAACGRQRLGGDMKHTTSRALFSYWDSVRAERIAPQRFEIDPSRISAILPYTFILERIDSETLRYRLAGTRMCEIFGSELRGTNFLDGWTAKDRMSLLRQVSVLSSQGAVLNLYVKLGASENETVECEVILLPLLHTTRTIARVLGALSPLSMPAWLTERPVRCKAILTNELVWPSGNAHDTIARMPDDRTPDVLRERPARIVRSQRRQFRVVDGGLSRSECDES
jgi:hypothetical protein